MPTTPSDALAHYAKFRTWLLTKANVTDHTADKRSCTEIAAATFHLDTSSQHSYPRDALLLSACQVIDDFKSAADDQERESHQGETVEIPTLKSS
jgi:hypothetical protein